MGFRQKIGKTAPGSTKKEDELLCLEKKYIEEMIAHAQSEAPNECCGILAGIKGKVTKLYSTTNAEHSPTRYSVEPQELFNIYQEIENRGWELWGIYHSHPHSEAYPSAIDIKYAYFPGSWYFIVSLSGPNQPVVRVFRIVKDKIEEEELKIVERGQQNKSSN